MKNDSSWVILSPRRLSSAATLTSFFTLRHIDKTPSLSTSSLVRMNARPHPEARNNASTLSQLNALEKSDTLGVPRRNPRVPLGSRSDLQSFGNTSGVASAHARS